MRPRLTRPDLREPTGPPLSPGQIRLVTGMSEDTIVREIAAGELIAFRTPGGHHRVFWGSARAWAIRLGVLRLRVNPASAANPTSTLHAS